MSKTTKIKSGHYQYRGFDIICLGYYPPEQRIVWEASEFGKQCADYHGFSLKDIKTIIDKDFEDGNIQLESGNYNNSKGNTSL